MFTTSTLPFLQNRTENIVVTAACKHFPRPAVARDIFLWEMRLLLETEDLKENDPSSSPPALRPCGLRRAPQKTGGWKHFPPQSVRSVCLLFATDLRTNICLQKAHGLPPKSHRKHRRGGILRTLSATGRREERVFVGNETSV